MEKEKYVLELTGVTKLITNKNKNINIMNGDIVEKVTDLGETCLVKFVFDSEKDIYGEFEIPKDVMKLIVD